MATTVTKTIKSSGGDYTSLSAWEAAQAGDLVTLDEIHVAECYSMPDTTAVTIDGWITDATRYIKIYTPTAERHDGKWNAAKYRLELSNGNSPIIQINEEYTRLDGLQIDNTVAKASVPMGIAFTITGTGEVQISNCILRASGTGTADYWSNGINTQGLTGAVTLKIRNSLVYDYGYGINVLENAARTNIFYNNTLHNNSQYGIALSSFHDQHTNYIKNNLMQGNGTDYQQSVWETNNTASNLTEDATSPDGAGYQSKVVTFVDEINDDFHLASGDTNAKDNGTDLSADAQLAFSDDIDGETRGSTWDVGADEYAAAGGASLDAAVSCAGTVVATLTTAVTMAASVAASGVVAAVLATSILLGGAVTGTATAAAALTTDIRLDAAPTSTVNATGALTTEIPLDAAVNATAAAQANLTTAINMTASGVGTAMATGDLTTPVAAQFSANASGTATAQGSLTTAINMTASASGSAAAAGALTTEIALDAAPTVSVIQASSLTTSINMAGTLSVVAVAAAKFAEKTQVHGMYVIQPENRMYVISPENRTYVIPPEDRRLIIQ